MLEQTKYCREIKFVKTKTSKQKITKEELSQLAYWFNMISEYTKINTITKTKETPEKYKVN